MNAQRETPLDPAAGSQLEALLARWRTSIALHQRYARLQDTQYWHVQPWPKHQRPVPLILDLADKQLAALERIVARRLAEKDRGFLEALHLMAGLSNLVGLQNIERFIPLADPVTERRGLLDDATRQMPALPAGKMGALLAAQKAGVPYKNKLARSTPSAAKPAPARASAPSRAVAPKPAPKSLEATVVDDVVRLLGWGRKTHELPDLIASMHGRPNAAGVRRIIKEYRVHIARQLGPR